MGDCVFCRIVTGEIPAERVYEDEAVVAFLDINPIAPGHTLVVPREHREVFTDLPAEAAANLTRAAQTVAAAVLKATGAEGFNLLMNNRRCAGQAIDHAHYHVIPRKAADGVRFNWPTRKYTEAASRAVTEAEHAAAEAGEAAERQRVAEAIRAATK